MKTRISYILIFFVAASILHAQGRFHTVIQAGILRLIPANRRPPAESEITIEKQGGIRKIESNGIPNHKVGRFPNRNNPNTIRPQAQVIEVPENPKPAENVTFMHDTPGAPRVFGVTLDGVLFEPGAAEFWQGNPYWQYEPLNGAVPLGLDENHAHVQPTGKYHYHGLPTGLMKRLGYQEGRHSPMIGWAADGFPIYVRYGYRDPMDPNSGIIDLQSSYKMYEGDRPGAPRGPGGTYDGAFIRDYYFERGSGDLDECNGRFCVTPEFPKGTYAYFLTEEWPVIPRAWRGTPVNISPGGFPGGGHPPHGGKGKGKGKGKGFPPPPPRRF